MGYYKIRNWEIYQYRKKDLKDGKRKLPWIMLHRSILNSEKWISLKDNEKAQFIAILLTANDDGCVTNDARMLQLCARLRRKPDLVKFCRMGLLTEYHGFNESRGAINAPSAQNREEKRREEERRGELEGVDMTSADQNTKNKMHVKKLIEKIGHSI